jgi:predicted aspartyl protease
VLGWSSVFVAVIVVSAAIAAGAQEVRPPAPTGAPAAARTLPIHYDEALARRGFPSPVLKVTVNGVTGWVLVDTGAGLHTLAAWFVEKAGLVSDASLTDKVGGRDASGERLWLRFLDEVSLTLEGTGTLQLGIAAVADFPKEFESARVAGLLSPQSLLVEGEALTLDLRSPSLRIQAAGPGSAGDRRADPLDACRSRAAQVPGLLFAVPVLFEGRSARLLVDTGASHTRLAGDASAAIGLPRDGTRDQLGVGGVREPMAVARTVSVRVGGLDQVADVAIGGGSSGCGGDGLLGIDVLRQCELVLTAGGGRLACGAR